jgi:hypothetical protein
MPVTDSAVTTLLENIKVNLQDAVNFTTCADLLRAVDIMAEFSILGRRTPFAVIVPGSVEI